MSQTRSGINRALMWLRKSLEITEETDSPQTLSEILRPTIDVFGWERLAARTQFAAASVAAPGIIVNGPVTPDGVLRLVLNASVRHTDTGVDHFIWIDLDMRGASAELVGITSPSVAVPPLVDQSTDRWFTIAPTHRFRGRAELATIAGALTLSMTFIDLPIGEYVPSL